MTDIRSGKVLRGLQLGKNAEDAKRGYARFVFRDESLAVFLEAEECTIFGELIVEEMCPECGLADDRRSVRDLPCPNCS